MGYQSILAETGRESKERVSDGDAETGRQKRKCSFRKGRTEAFHLLAALSDWVDKGQSICLLAYFLMKTLARRKLSSIGDTVCSPMTCLSVVATVEPSLQAFHCIDTWCNRGDSNIISWQEREHKDTAHWESISDVWALLIRSDKALGQLRETGWADCANFSLALFTTSSQLFFIFLPLSLPISYFHFAIRLHAENKSNGVHT